jgi:hypothetical protein
LVSAFHAGCACRKPAVICAMRLCERDSGLEPPDDFQPPADSVRHSQPVALRYDVRHEQCDRPVGAHGIFGVRREYADDLVDVVVEPDDASDHTGITAIATLPERVAQYRHAVAPVDLVGHGVGAPDGGPNS